MRDRKGANVVEMSVADDNGLGAVVGEVLIAGEGIGSLLLGMHPGVEQDRFPIQIEGITIPANLRAEIEGLEGEAGHGAGR